MDIYKRGDAWHFRGTIDGERVRAALGTKNYKEALKKSKDLIADFKAGKRADKAGRDFARLSLADATKRYVEERKGRVAERTLQIDRERSKPLKAYFGQKQLAKITAADITNYQNHRKAKGISNRTINMDVGVLRQMLKRAKRWKFLNDDVKPLPENTGAPKDVLTAEQKALLFQTAGSKPQWEVAYWAAVLAVNTTCRSVELKHLCWKDVDFLEQEIRIRRSKTEKGLRTLPLTPDAMTVLSRLLERARLLGCSEPEHYVFPACENHRVDSTKPQKTWRTAWRTLRAEAAKRAGDLAVKAAALSGADKTRARERAMKPFLNYRFHDLRHQAITEMAENGVADATLKAIAGHMSNEMMEHYSHVRMAKKKSAVAFLGGGCMPVVSSSPKSSLAS